LGAGVMIGEASSAGRFLEIFNSFGSSGADFNGQKN